MPGERKAITSLFQIEDRLTRLLDLAGNVGASFTPELFPSVLVGDATAPGYNSSSGRRFQGTVVATSAAASIIVLKAAADIVIDRLSFTTALGGVTVQVNIMPADGGADPVATATLSTIYTELNMLSAEKAPLLNSAVTAGVFGGNPIWRERSFTTPPMLEAIPAIHLPVGCRLIVGTVDATGLGALAFLNWCGHVL